jgi:hypothetical protein
LGIFDSAIDKQPALESATAIDVFLRKSLRDEKCVILFSL